MTLGYIPQPARYRALDAGEWYAEAIRLEAENRELRRIITAIVLWATWRAELLRYTRELAEERWP